MNDITVEPSNIVLSTFTNNQVDLGWDVEKNSISSESTNESEEDQNRFQSLKDNTWKRVLAFGLFTILAATIGIIVVCLTAPNESDDRCLSPFEDQTVTDESYDRRPKHVAIGDFDRDDQADLVIAYSAFDSIGVLFNLNHNIFIEHPILYYTGEDSIPVWVSVGYLNNDTVLDIAVANYGTNNIGIFIGNNDSTFEDQTIFSLNASRPLALAIDDFNNDTYLDIVVISNGTFYLTLLLGDGNGSFSIDSEYYMGHDSMPCSLAVNDFDNDNRSDIVITNCGTNDIAILFATDNGRFIMDRYSTGTGSHPCSVSVGDFDDDDYIDIAIVTCGSSNIGILLGNEDGTFTYLANYSTGTNSRLQFIVASFINDNDDNLDLIVANPGEDAIMVFEGSGNGSFVMKANQSTGYSSDPCSIVVGDFDGNNQIDVAVTNIGNNYVLIFTAYNYQVTATQAAYSLYDGSYPESVGVGDLNNDGQLDIVIACRYIGYISVAMGFGDGSFDNDMIITMISPDSEPFAVGIGDFNMDKYLDIAVSLSGYGRIDVYLGQGNGNFEFISSLLSNYTELYVDSLAIGDFNNDTYLDIVATYCNQDVLLVFLGNGNGTFQNGKSYSTEENACPLYVSTGDFNNDGVLDFASANYVRHSVNIFIGYGNGTFQALTTIPFDDYYPRWLVIGDLNNDKKQDIVLTSSDDSSIGILLGYGNGTFKNIFGYYTGSDAYPVSVVLGDFSKDNKIDIAVVNKETADIVIFLNDGQDKFIRQNPISIEGASYPLSMATGDFNHDKQIDIVVGNLGTDDVSVLLFKYQIAFGNRTNFNQGSGSHPFSLTSAHLDDDQQIDIVVANTANNTIQLLIGYQTNGTFLRNIIYSTRIDSHPKCVVTGDFNKDNYTDVAVVNSYTDTLMIFLLLNNGALLQSYEYSTGSMSFPNSLALGDFNKDGWIDIVVANNNTNNVGIFLGYNYSSFITNSLSGPQRGSRPYDVIVADFNNDSECDLVVAYRQIDTIGIFLGNGDGTFRNQSLYTTDDLSKPMSLAVVDFNNDTILDIAIANSDGYSISILLGSQNGTFLQDQSYSTGYASPFSIAFGDFNNDNKQDLVVATSSGNNIGIFFGYGNGSFADQVVYEMGKESLPADVVVADFNNDNIPDIAVANYGANHIGILLGYGNGTFRALTAYSTGANSHPSSIAVADFNKDTCIDIAVANEFSKNVGIFYGDCNGSFSSQTTYATGLSSDLVAIKVNDLNNDGILDIIVIDWGTGDGNIGILYGMKNGSFLTPKKYPTGFNSEPSSVAICDFNHDGKLDLAVTSSKKNTIDIMLQNQTEPFGEQTTYFTGNQSHPYSVAVDDFDNDDQLDIVVANFQTDTVGLFYGYGDGRFQGRITYSIGNGSRPMFVATGYINNDTYSDIIIVNSNTDNIAILYGYENRTFRNIQTHSTGQSSAPSSVAVGYLNRDNYTDIVVTNAGINNVLVFYGYGNGTFREPELLPFDYGDNPISATLGDYNNDGLVDIALVDNGPGNTDILFQTCDVSFY